MPSTAVEEQTDTPSPRREDGLDEELAFGLDFALELRGETWVVFGQHANGSDWCYPASFTEIALWQLVQSLRTQLGAARHEIAELVADNASFIIANETLEARISTKRNGMATLCECGHVAPRHPYRNGPKGRRCEVRGCSCTEWRPVYPDAGTEAKVLEYRHLAASMTDLTDAEQSTRPFRISARDMIVLCDGYLELLAARSPSPEAQS